MNSKLKNMEIILNIGSIILFFAGLGILITPDLDSNIIKFVISLSIGGLSLLFSFICSKVLNVKSSSKLLYYLSMIIICITYAFGGFNGLYGGYFGYDLEGSELFLSSIYLLIAILSIITKCLFKNYSILHLAFIAIYVSIYHLFIHFSFNYQVAFIVIGALLFIGTFLNNGIIKNFSITASYTYVLLSILIGYSDSLILSSLLFSINMLVIYNALYKDNNVICELVTLGFIVASIIIFGNTISNNFDVSVSYIITAFVIGILELLIHHYNVIDSNVNKIFYKTVFVVMYLVLSILSIDTGVTTFLPVTIFMTLSSIAYTHILKSGEDSLQGIKVLVFMLALLLNVDEFIFDFSDIVYVYILGLSSVMMFLFSKRDSLKITSELASFILLVPLIVMTKETNLVFYITSTLLIALYVFVFLSDMSSIDKNFNSCLSSLYCYALFALTIDSIEPIRFLLSSIVLLAIMVLVRKDNTKFVIALFFMFFTIKGFINHLVPILDIDGNFHVIINSIILILTIITFAYKIFDNKKTRNIFLTLFSVLQLYFLLMYDELPIVLYILILSLLLLVLGGINRELKSLFIVGIIFTIISILNIMNYIDGLPVSVYFIIIGITLIVSISILIYRYQRKPEEEKVNNTPLEIKTRYCSNCGTKNKDNDKYCENCGSNLFGLNNYCGNCGTKIHSDDKYCPNCGSKI
ncbi:MAG: zinc ribbon domain-containing protein [Bacilli bacterium]|nr:zinc ribbon domain-containing protein [Bacilli bacterium]